MSVSDNIRKDFDDELLLTANINDNWGISTVEWLVDNVVIDSYNDVNWQDGKTFTFRFDSSYTAGNHEVTIRVTDKEGQITEKSANVELYDSTPPLVPRQTEEVSVILGQPFTFTAEAIDEESSSLVYSWDLDVNTDSDLDGIKNNDVDESGSSITQIFNQKGTFEVVCTVVNEGGVSTQITYFVTVRSSSDDGTGLSPLMIGVGIFLGLLIIIAIVGMITWRRMSNARLEALLEEQNAAEEEKPRELTVEEQKAMYGQGSTTLDQPTSMSTTSQFGQFATGMSGDSNPESTAAGDEVMDDLDLEALMSSSQPETTSDVSSPASELLAEFSDDENSVAEEPVEYSHDDSQAISEEVWSPDQTDSVVDEPLPTPPPPESELDLEDLSSDDDLPTPPVPASEPLPEPPAPEDELEEEKTEEDSNENQQNTPQSRVVQQDCSQCQQRFEVTLPEGHDIARTACPSCGAIETVRLS